MAVRGVVDVEVELDVVLTVETDNGDDVVVEDADDADVLVVLVPLSEHRELRPQAP